MGSSRSMEGQFLTEPGSLSVILLDGVMEEFAQVHFKHKHVLTRKVGLNTHSLR